MAKAWDTASPRSASSLHASPRDLVVKVPDDWSSDGFEGIPSICGSGLEAFSAEDSDPEEQPRPVLPAFPEATPIGREDGPVPVSSSEVLPAEDLGLADGQPALVAKGLSPGKTLQFAGMEDKGPRASEMSGATSVVVLQSLTSSDRVREAAGRSKLTVASKMSKMSNMSKARWTLKKSFSVGRLSIFPSVRRRQGMSGRLGTTAGFSLLVCSASVLLCALAYVALPGSNPLQGLSEWWHCLLPCALFWAPLTTLNYCMLLQQFLYNEHAARLPLRAAFLLYVSGTASMVAAEYALMHLWMNPPVLNSAILATVAFHSYSIILTLLLVPELGTECGIGWRTRLPFPSNPLWKLQVRALFLIFFSTIAALQLLLLLVCCAALMKLDIGLVSVPVLLFLRIALCNLQEHLAAKLEQEDAWLVGINLVVLTTGIANVLTAASAQEWGTTILFFLADCFFVMLRVLSLANLEVRGVKISEVLLDKKGFLRRAWNAGSLREAADHTLEAELRSRRCRLQMAYIIAAEIGEVIVPISYNLCWLVVRAGPNAVAFTGVGTSDLGLRVPSDFGFLVHSGCLILLNMTVLLLVKLALRKLCRVYIERESVKVFKTHGPVLACQAVWLIVSAFCMTMIQCGLDFSLQWSYVARAAGA